jgi:hypothetical protein
MMYVALVYSLWGVVYNSVMCNFIEIYVSGFDKIF